MGKDAKIKVPKTKADSNDFLEILKKKRTKSKEDVDSN